MVVVNHWQLIIYQVKKDAYKKYVEECFGEWNENIQRELYEKFINNVKDDTYIIQLNGVDIGFYNGEVLEDGSYEVSEVVNPLYNPELASSIVPSFFDAATALNMRILVAALYLVAAVMQFVGLALVYNLDKKTLAKMNEDLAARKSDVSAEEVDPELV